jgi:F420-dependent oxidoreductase-like protein
MKVGIDVSQHQLEWPEIRSRVVWAEEAGFESAWVFDHFTALYGDPQGPCLEAWTLLAGLGEATSRIRLGALVTGVTYRHPSLLAAEVVTVDHVSAGRLDVGLGAAWHDGEHRRLGFDFPGTGERIERLDETIQIVKALLTADDVDFDGRHYRLRKAFYRPRPVQRPHPPIWIGGAGEQLTLRFVAELADVWNFTGSPNEARHKAGVLDRHCAEVGRDPGSIRRTIQMRYAGDPEAALRTCEEMRELGFEDVIFTVSVDDGRRLADEVAEKLLPRLRGAG